MPASLIRSRTMITHALDRHHWNEVTDGAVFQEDGVIAEIGSFAQLSRKHPDCVGHRHRQRNPAAGLRQWPSPYRFNPGAARLAGHAVGALVRHAHARAQPQPLSLHALFRLRDGLPIRSRCSRACTAATTRSAASESSSPPPTCTGAQTRRWGGSPTLLGNMASRCTCISWRRLTRRSMRAGVAVGPRSNTSTVSARWVRR